MFACLGMGLEGRVFRYLPDSPLVCMSGDGLGRQSLSLFMRLSPCLHVWRWAGNAYYVAIYAILPSLAYLGLHLERIICRYLRDSPLVGIAWDALGEHNLSLFM